MNEEYHATNPKTRKPSVLYHASKNRKISEFEPRAEKIRDKFEGPVIFATPDKIFATCFLVPTDSSWANSGRFTTGGVPETWHMVISNRERFLELDKGGAVYILPSDSFSYVVDLGMGDLEWVSKVPVKPIENQVYESGLQAMKEAGVEVYFVDKETFEAINSSNDHGKSIIDKLTPEQ